MKTSQAKFFSMELFTIITALSICLSFMLSTCASDQQILVKPPCENGHDLRLKLPAVPRKLRLIEEANVKIVGNKNYAPQIKQEEEALSDKQHKKEANLLHERKGTRQEWIEGTDTSQYFTMDYWHVRRRRPIHNKHVPVSP